jgi:endoglycosylceramidase
MKSYPRSFFILFFTVLTPLVFMGVSLAAGLHIDGRFFRDDQGRAVILRGINVTNDMKVPPSRGINDPSELDILPTLGFNMIRLVFTWETYEPQPGQYDEAYLDYYASIVDAAWKRGVYTLVDFHQDIFSRYVAKGCGCGFPAWAVSPDHPAAIPDNGPNCENWTMIGISSADMHDSWRDFYAERAGVRTRFVMLWERLAARFADHPGVIGYDIINEPWGDENLEIVPLYEDTAKAILKHDAKANIFVEPTLLAGMGVPSVMRRPDIKNLVFAPHFYDPQVWFLKMYSGLSIMDATLCNMKVTADRWNAPLFIGEFGVEPSVLNALLYMDDIYDLLNTHLTSATQWNYTPNWTDEAKDGWNMKDLSIVDDQGSLRGNFRIRPYPQKISGTPIKINVSQAGMVSKASIMIKWNNNPASGDTEIFLPKQKVFGDAELKIIKSPGVNCRWNADETRLDCSSTTRGNKSVFIRPCHLFMGRCL